MEEQVDHGRDPWYAFYHQSIIIKFTVPGVLLMIWVVRLPWVQSVVECGMQLKVPRIHQGYGR
jgi:hypothetical protein